MKHLHNRLDKLEDGGSDNTPPCVVYGPGMDYETLEEAKASVPDDANLANVAFVGFGYPPLPDNHPDNTNP